MPKQTKKETAKKETVKSAPAVAAVAPSTGDGSDLVAKITAQGDKVRALKSSKAPKVKIFHSCPFLF